MKKIKYMFPFIIILALSLISCANGGNEERKQDTTMNTTPTGPAPDNSAATNPSLGDTLYDNQDTTNLHDTGKHK